MATKKINIDDKQIRVNTTYNKKFNFSMQDVFDKSLLQIAITYKNIKTGKNYIVYQPLLDENCKTFNPVIVY